MSIVGSFQEKRRLKRYNCISRTPHLILVHFQLGTRDVKEGEQVEGLCFLVQLYDFDDHVLCLHPLQRLEVIGCVYHQVRFTRHLETQSDDYFWILHTAPIWINILGHQKNSIWLMKLQQDENV